MSMNLYCEEVELWQTPTYITYMCYSNNDGGFQGIRYRYTQWVKSHLNGVWDDVEDYTDTKERIKEHLEKLNSYKKLRFYVS